MLITKALYGLKTSRNEWHLKLAGDLYNIGFVPSKADGDLWMRNKGDHYEYIAVFVDYLLIFSN